MENTSTPHTSVADNFQITLDVNNEKYTCESSSIMDALEQLPTLPFIKTKATFTVVKNGVTKIHTLHIPTLRKLLTQNVVKEIWAKRLIQALG